MKFLKNRDGSVALEAALVMPLLAMLLLATIEFGQAFTVKRRVALVASTASDLVARASCLTQSNLQDIATIGNTILPSAKTTTLGLRLTSLNANGTVNWSYATGTLSPAKSGSAFNLPSGIAGQSKPMVVAETSYAFTPTVSQFLNPITFSYVSYNFPRFAATVPLKTSC